MKYRIFPPLFVMIICLGMACPAVAAPAQDAGPGQKQKPGLYILSVTDLSSVKNEELAGVYVAANNSLIGQIRDGLSARSVNVDVVKSAGDIKDPARFILAVRIVNIELGRRRPFGRTAKVKVSYAFQNKDRFDLVKRSVEETSVQKWQNCINTISEQVVNDTSNDLVKRGQGDS